MKSSTKPAYIQVRSIFLCALTATMYTDLNVEQYSNTFNDDQIKTLHDSIMSICTTACETLADSAQFPETWLMKYRWDKGKKDSNVLPNGEKIVHLKVGGRTSAIVPSVQKKTAAVAGDIDSAEVSEAEKPAKGRKRKAKSEEVEENEKPVTKKAATKGRVKAKAVKAEQNEEDANGGAEDVDAKPKKTKSASKKEAKPATPASRRSTRTKAT
jgi:formamidopyrimidine-DNA glycosylase